MWSSLTLTRLCLLCVCRFVQLLNPRLLRLGHSICGTPAATAPVSCVVDWLICLLVDLLVDLLVGWLVGRLVSWLLGWLLGWSLMCPRIGSSMG